MKTMKTKIDVGLAAAVTFVGAFLLVTGVIVTTLLQFVISLQPLTGTLP